MLTPEDITSRSFLVSLRGYDRDEVHAFLAQVADSLRDREERIAELEEEVTAPAASSAAAPAAPAAPAPEAASGPSDLFAQIGQETQRILEAAQTAGEEIRRKAETEAAELRRTAQAETDELRSRTQQETDDLRSTTEQEVAELRSSAKQETEELRRTAREEVEALRSAAEQEVAELRRTTKEAADKELKSARSQATKIIADGERRREAVEATVAELSGTRDQLASQLREAGRSLERTLRDIAGDPEPTATMREAVSASVREDAATGDTEAAGAAGAGDGADSGVDTEVADVVAEDGAAAPADEQRAVEDEGDEPQPATDVDEVTGGDAAAPVADVDAPVVADAAEVATDATAEEAPAAEEPDEGPDADIEAGADARNDDDADDEVAGEVAGADATGDAATGDAATGDATVTDELPAVADADAEPAAQAPAGPTPSDEVMEEAQALRAAALAPLHPKLVRKLKRGLQDLQNGILDRLRRADAKGEADAFLPDYTAISTLSALSEEFLVTAWWAGTASGELLAGEEVDAPEPEAGLAEELTSALADQLMAELASGLTEGLTAEEDIVVLGERIAVIFTDVKEAPVEELAALALLRTYEEGLHAAWTAGSVTQRHWALASEPPCEDPRCADNHRAGPVDLGSSFASGHMSPPVRVGCNCTTVPATP